ncbi:MAG: peptide chain release factor 1, partial [Candidatus Aenigmarchaeota archaeon]|nr:peptide chain release factor 1 [Candidatus Aenigmarchaeota archaeon]
VSVYVPADYELNKTVAQLRSEQSTSQNIKSKTVKKNVTAALERILQQLKLYTKTPPNGLALFAGNVSEKEGVTDIQVYAVEPMEPLKTKLYHCGQEFILDPLGEMVREKEIYGLLVFDKSEANIGLIKGKHVENVKHLESIVPGKTRKGGQSAHRFERVRENLLADFLKKIAEVAIATYRGMPDLRGIVVAGPGPTKEDFMKDEYLPTDVRNKVIGIVDTSYTGEYGLKEAMERAEHLIAEASIVKEKKLMDRFFEQLGGGGLAVYGMDGVKKAIAAGNLDILLVSEAFNFYDTIFGCECGNTVQKIAEKGVIQKCDKCGRDMVGRERKDILTPVVLAAEQIGTRVEQISTGTEKGRQLLALGGIGGLLRYRME